MLPLREIDVMGVLIAPVAACLPLAALGTCLLLAALRRIPGTAPWARSPAIELSLGVAVLSCLVLLLGRV